MKRLIGKICLLASFSILVAVIVVYGPHFMDYKKAGDLYDEIRKKNTSRIDPELPFETDQTETADEPLSENEQAYEGTEEISKKEKELKRLRNVLKLADPDLDIEQYLPIEVDGEALLKENPDYAGWIYIPGTVVSYPVVQSHDNSDYLHTNFQKGYNYSGTIFIDSNCKGGMFDRHVIIYGHNMNDGSMFSIIKSYIDETFAKEHPYIWFITPEKMLLYRIFSAYESTPSDKVTYSYDGKDFHSDDEWGTIAAQIKNRSVFSNGQEVTEKDQVITLSTCSPSRVTRIVPSAVLYCEFENAF